MQKWSPNSWTDYTYDQSVEYPDVKTLIEVCNKLVKLPPLVSSGEIKKLKNLIKNAGKGEAFILQGGDCAESFNECRSDIISNKLKILLQMSLILIHGLKKPVIRVGRIAGQYAKPRSSAFETIDNITLPTYRGDIINSPEFNAQSRIPDPQLLLQGYNHASTTLNFIRALLSGGFADLHHPHRWDLSFAEHSPQKNEYHSIVNSIGNSLDFLETIDGLKNSNINHVDFYTSHEALHLHYEQALTRTLKDNKNYLMSTHFPWIGMRTANLNSAHIEFLRGIENPIGIKVGPNVNVSSLVEIINILNPLEEEGKIVLITRLGADKIDELLPNIINEIQINKIPVTWISDPMHGNTETTVDGIKTRHFDNILTELQKALAIHSEMNSFLGGVHFELTGDNVTECIGGARGLDVGNLKEAYMSLVDPRLNYEQSLEIALQISKQFKNKN